MGLYISWFLTGVLLLPSERGYKKWGQAEEGNPASEPLLTKIFHCTGCFCSICNWTAHRQSWGASWYTHRRVVHSDSYPFIIITGKQLCKIQLTRERLCFAGNVYEPHVHSCYMKAKWRGNPFQVLSLKKKPKRQASSYIFQNALTILTQIFS